MFAALLLLILAGVVLWMAWALICDFWEWLDEWLNNHMP